MAQTARKPTARKSTARKAAPASRARARPAARKPQRPSRPRTVRPAHHDAELVGLGLLAIGVFLACVLWFGLSGGPVPGALRSAIGWAAYALPVILGPLGTLMVVRSELVALRPFRFGVSLAVVGLALALGRTHGGWVGRHLEGIAAVAVGTTGATILGALLAVAGTLFFTGASLGAVLRRSGHVLHTARDRVRIERQYADDPLPVPVAAPVAAPASRGRARRTVLQPIPEISDSSSTGSSLRHEPPVDADKDFPDLIGKPDAKHPVKLPPPYMPDRAEPGRLHQPAAEEAQGSIFEAEAHHEPGEYTLPDPAVLKKSAPGSGPNAEANRRVAEALLTCLANFGVEATVIGQISGPRVTRYELQLAPGIKVGKVAQLRDDLSYALATTEIRILAPIPGKQAVGVEVPNLSPNLVTLGDIFGEIPPSASPLSVWLGKGIDGVPVYSDLARMPHLLIAGTTGSGKSGCINAILSSILLRATPDQVRMILIDPKRIELNHYESIPHLLTPVVSSPKEASAVLLNVVTEMERRYERLAQVRARGLPEANRAFRKRGEPELPYLLVVIDELADLMMVSPQDVEDAIIRLAQKSRAVGIHLVLATQRPSVDVITGMIKANVPSRIAFAVSSQTDSRVILDQNGAESLLGQGDMLYKPMGDSRLQRVQGAFITEDEVALIVEQTRIQRDQQVDETFLQAPQVFADDGEGGEDGEFDPDEDALLDRAIEVVVMAQTASVSLLQRRLRVGYTRAGRLIDMLERRGIISPYEGSKPRTVLISEADLERPS